MSSLFYRLFLLLPSLNSQIFAPDTPSNSLSNTRELAYNTNISSDVFGPDINLSSIRSLCLNYTFPSVIPPNQSHCNGDGFIQFQICEPCHEGSYIVHAFSNLTCFACTEQMECSNQTLKPTNVSYRFSDKLCLVFRKCPNPDACNGSYPDPVLPKFYRSSCKEGYKGTLCHDCEKGFTKVSLSNCERCPTVWKNVLIILALVLMISFFAFYLVKTTAESTFQPEELYSIGLRIFMNYCQVIYLCLQYKIGWPETVQNFTNSKSNESGSTGQSAYFFSLKCLFNPDLEEIDLFYYRLYFMISAPIILFIGSFAAIGIIKIFKIVYDIKYYKSATIIIPYLLIYPTVLSYSLSPWACVSLGVGKPDNFDEYVDFYPSLLIENRAINCDSLEHIQYSLLVTIIGLLLWGIGVPVYIISNLYEHRKNLFEDQVKIKYGFMFNGYTHSRYYWEFVILFKKLWVIFLTVITESLVNYNLQSTLLITFLLLFFILQILFNPYITEELNRLEAYASLAAIFTILCGILYEGSAQAPIWQYLISIIIIVVNSLFIILWMKFMLREGVDYLIRSFMFLRKRFYRKDGFDEEITKQFNTVKCIYTKENQKLYTQINDLPPTIENYLGNTRTMIDLYAEIVKISFTEYRGNEIPVTRSIVRRRSQMYRAR